VLASPTRRGFAIAWPAIALLARGFAAAERHKSCTTARFMTASASGVSPIDDSDFVGELGKFGTEPSAHARIGTQGSSTDALIDDLDDVWEPRGALSEPATESSPAPASPPAPPRVRARKPQRVAQPEFEYALAVEERHTVRKVVGFLLMMALGGESGNPRLPRARREAVR
jgi:hypothetical protein